MKFEAIKNQIDNFLFAPSSPYPVAAFRILFGLIILQQAFFIFPDLYEWYGVKGLYLDESNAISNPFISVSVLNIFAGNDTWLLTVFILYVLSAVALVVGFKSRAASFLVWLFFVSFYHRNCFHLNSGDTFIRVIAFWLMLAPSSAAWSFDHLQRQKKLGANFSELIPNWGLRCLQIQFCLVYFHAFITKAPGWTWVYGTAVYISSRLEGLMKFPLFISPEDVIVSKLVTWMTLAIEFSLFTFIWIKELRYYIIALAVCMHLTIDWSMNIPQFEWTMIFTMVTFVYPKDLQRFSTFATSLILRKPSSKAEQMSTQS